MKKLIALILTLATLCAALFALTSCLPTSQLKIGYMTGPTGMGMAKLVHDNGGLEAGNEKYQFNKYTDTSLALLDLVKGDVDIVCLPTNEAANNYNADYDELTVLSINTLGSVYLITNGVEIDSFVELEGQTIYTCLKGTPRLILEYLLDEAGVNATVVTEFDEATINTPEDLKNTLVNKNGISIAVAPEPVVTAVTSAKPQYSVALNLNDVWNDFAVTPLAMGCVVSTKEFVDNNKNAVDKFLSEYKASIEFIDSAANIELSAQYVVDAGVMAAVGAAKKALNNLRGSIAYIDGEVMKSALIGFYTAIGVGLPDDTFYYEK